MRLNFHKKRQIDERFGFETKKDVHARLFVYSSNVSIIADMPGGSVAP